MNYLLNHMVDDSDVLFSVSLNLWGKTYVLSRFKDINVPQKMKHFQMVSIELIELLKLFGINWEQYKLVYYAVQKASSCIYSMNGKMGMSWNWCSS